jgi:NitT/TauT family transport system substrate-binding protein
MAKRARIMVGYYYPWTNDAGILLARDRGYFAEEGIEADFSAGDPGRGDTLAYLSEGDVDFGIFPTNRLLKLRESRPNVTAVAAINQRGLETIQTVRGKGIESPADLAGRTIALAPTPRGLAMVKHVAARNGVDPESLSFYDSGAGELSAAQIRESDAYDATFGSYWAWDIPLDESLPDEDRLYWPVDEIGAPRYHSYLLGVNDRHIEEDPEFVSGFVRALGRAYADIASEPLSAAPLFARYVPFLPVRAVERSLPLIAGTWLLDGRWGAIREDYMEEYAHWLADSGILKDREGWKSSYTEEYVPQA